MARMGKIYAGKRLKIKSRKELLASIRPQLWKYLRADAGDMPDSADAIQESQPVPVLGIGGSET
jgi:hypothetical protein